MAPGRTPSSPVASLAPRALMSDPTLNGPFVALAVLCQRMDRQADGSADVVGIVDGLNLDSPFLGDQSDAEAPTVMLTALVSIRAGEIRGQHVLAIRGRYPSGILGPSISRLVELTDQMPAATLSVPLELELEQLGTYWFDVTFDQILLTRIPLVVCRGEPWS
jgi:hypothetical protein